MHNNASVDASFLSKVRRALPSMYVDAETRLAQIGEQLAVIERQLEELPEDDFSCRSNLNNCKWFRVVHRESAADNSSDGSGESSGRGSGSGPRGGSGESSERGSGSDPHGSSGAVPREGLGDGQGKGLRGGRHRRPRCEFEYIPKSQEEVAAQLAYRKYLFLLANDLRNEQQALGLYLNRFDRGSRSAEKFLDSCGVGPLLRPRLETNYDRALQWQNEPYDKNMDYPEGLTVPTIGGFKVRSKSEALIADILIERKIPFRYEYVQLIDQRRYSPDFTIMHPETGAIVIWEHFGLLSDNSYRAQYLSKSQRYISDGFLPYTNLIMTYETNSMPFSAEKANDIVKMMFHC